MNIWKLTIESIRQQKNSPYGQDSFKNCPPFQVVIVEATKSRRRRCVSHAIIRVVLVSVHHHLNVSLVRISSNFIKTPVYGSAPQVSLVYPKNFKMTYDWGDLPGARGMSKIGIILGSHWMNLDYETAFGGGGIENPKKPDTRGGGQKIPIFAGRPLWMAPNRF